MKRRWLWAALALPVAAYGFLIAEAYVKPSLGSGGYSQGYLPSGERRLGLELENWGRWPLTLVDAQLEGVPTNQVMAWISHSGWLADNQAIVSEEMLREHDSPYETRPVEGLRVEPQRDIYPRQSYAIRLDIPIPAQPGQVETVIRYRYLGWPFTLRTKVEVPNFHPDFRP